MTSTIRPTGEAEPLGTWICPSGPTGATTVVATVCPAAKFRFDVPGREAPDGHTVTYPAARGATTVTVSTTAAPFAGIPPIPVTFIAATAAAGTTPGTCHASRESATLAGVTVAIVPAPIGCRPGCTR